MRNSLIVLSGFITLLVGYLKIILTLFNFKTSLTLEPYFRNERKKNFCVVLVEFKWTRFVHVWPTLRTHNSTRMGGRRANAKGSYFGIRETLSNWRFPYLAFGCLKVTYCVFVPSNGQPRGAWWKCCVYNMYTPEWLAVCGLGVVVFVRF